MPQVMSVSGAPHFTGGRPFAGDVDPAHRPGDQIEAAAVAGTSAPKPESAVDQARIVPRSAS
jgi:hypothetical protein